MFFRDRSDAGRKLAESLGEYAGREGVIVLGLPRGGVPVAYEIATALRAPLDVYLVRKLGMPAHEEVAMGAVASDGSYVIDEAAIEAGAVSPREFRKELVHEFGELKRREVAYRDDLPEPIVKGRTVILVDDGLATGATMYAAVNALRQAGPALIVVAVPVASAEACAALQVVADRVVCPNQLGSFGAVGYYYVDFAQTSDENVRQLLQRAARNQKSWQAA